MAESISRLYDTKVGSLAVEIVGPSNGSYVLLWPSIFTSARLCFGKIIPALVHAGHCLLLVDPPGQGKSGPAGAPFSIEDCAEAVHELLYALQIQRLTAMIGLSWGGFIALDSVLTGSDRISALVILNSAADLPDDQILEGHRRSLAAVEANGLIEPIVAKVVPALISETSTKQRPELVEALTREVAGLERTATVLNMRAVLIERGDILAELDSVTMPVLIIAGTEDRQLPVVHSERMIEALPNGQLMLLEKVGHLASAEAPYVVASRIVKFLASVKPKAS